jgi:hypothetical protein
VADRIAKLRATIASLRVASQKDDLLGGEFYSVSYDDEGINLVAAPELVRLFEQGLGSRLGRQQQVLLELLQLEGHAVAIVGGYSIPAMYAVDLEDDECVVLGLHGRFHGSLITKVRSDTRSPSFSISASIIQGTHPESYFVRGAELQVGKERYLLRRTEWLALSAIRKHEKVPAGERNEAQNVELVAELQAAVRGIQGNERLSAALTIDLGHLRNFETATVETVRLVVTPERDGSLTLRPDLFVAGIRCLEPDVLDSRLAQISSAEETAVLRAGGQLFRLGQEPLKGVQEVLRMGRIPAELAADFLEAPASFIDPLLVDLEHGFSRRVIGIERIVGTEFGKEASGLSWFNSVEGHPDLAPKIEQFEFLHELEECFSSVHQSWLYGDKLFVLDGQVYDIADRERTEALFEKARRRLKIVGGGATGSPATVGLVVDDVEQEDLAGVFASARRRAVVLPQRLVRQPLPHQEEGIRWLEGLLHASESPGSDTQVRGGLLADDMGLGKTYTILTALAAHIEWRRTAGVVDRPTLIVLPLSLIENWEAEIAQTFASSPFLDTVVLQSSRDLGLYGVGRRRRETILDPRSIGASGDIDLSAVRLSLKVGHDWGRERLDVPGRLVITTYETLRDYQLSMAQVDWGVVVFDEAQSIKNPRALKTRAAKALKSSFVLLSTGTPVENSLMDLWCLVDTAQPGLLGSSEQFRRRWLADDGRGETSEDLRRQLGDFMLRRTKEEHLQDLPPKTIWTAVPRHEHRNNALRADLAVSMPPLQERAYLGEQRAHADRIALTPAAALITLQNLRSISLHPRLAGFFSDEAIIGDHSDSGRMRATIVVLREIRERDEKVIVFVISRQMQRLVATELEREFAVPVSVVNGDTAAISTSEYSNSRRGLISRFERRPGFGIIVMSPLAVGVGVTVVGANHAVLLERHWNPAKEAQAIDRIHRIGQTRPVNVYLPMATLGEMPSFDLTLDTLLQKKVGIQRSVLAPIQEVTEAEMLNALGLQGRHR